jgi:hypothetical protein
LVGVGVGGIEGQPTKNSQAVPTNGAVITTKQVSGNADGFVKLELPEPGPDTFGYPKALSCELYDASPLKPVSITKLPL